MSKSDLKSSDDDISPKKVDNQPGGGSLIDGALKGLGVFYAWNLVKGGYSAVKETFDEIALRNFPETKKEWGLTEAEIRRQARAMGMFAECKNKRRSDCVSIYLAAQDQSYFRNKATTSEIEFIEEYDRGRLAP